MPYDFPAEVRELIDQKMASGKYPTEDELLTRALHALTDYEQAVADIQEGIDDEAAGRVRPLSDVDAAIREDLGFSK